LIPENERVIVLPSRQDFETYLATAAPEYLDVLRDLIVEYRAKNDYHRTALREEWASKTSDQVVAELQTFKTQYGARVPGGFATLADHKLRVPEKIRVALDLAYSGGPRALPE
jgi:hypothetical protein